MQADNELLKGLIEHAVYVYFTETEIGSEDPESKYCRIEGKRVVVANSSGTLAEYEFADGKLARVKS